MQRLFNEFSPFNHSLILSLFAVFTIVSFSISDLAAQNARYVETAQGRQIELTTRAGDIIMLGRQGDQDEDEIADSLEIFGFTYSITDGLQPWDGDSSVVFYKTDPLRWSTDGDPYSDLMEVSGVNMPAGVPAPYNHPLVAARPVIMVAMEEFDVHPIGTISNSNGGSQSTSHTNESSYTEEQGGEISSDLSFSPAGLGGGIGVTASYSQTWTTTESTTSTFGTNWSETWSTNPAEAASLTLRVFLENLGSATALDVIPTFNLVLGAKTIATITIAEENAAEILAAHGLPNSRYPSIGTIAIEQDFAGNPITVTMDELRAIQMGAPLSLVVTQVSANVARWNPETESFDAEVEWSSFEAEIDPVVTSIKANLGDDDIRYYQVYVETEYYSLDFNFRDVLKHVFNVQESPATSTIEGRTYPGDWYVSTASELLLDAWDDLGQPDNLMDLPMFPNTLLAMMSPGNDPAPEINLAIYSHDFKKVYVSAYPNNFPIISARAHVTIDGEAHVIELARSDSALFTNEIPFDGYADPLGTVVVENARGDISEATIAFPAAYTNAEDVKMIAGIIPNPGGNFLLFHNGNPERPFEAYCLFFDLESGEELETPREYLPLPESNNSNNFVDLSKNGEIEDGRKRVWWNKLRINPRTLKVDRSDTTFNDFEIISGNWYSGDIDEYFFGSVTLNHVELFDSVHANINLNGTPFALPHMPEYSTLWTSTAMSIDVAANRKSADIMFWPYADYVTDHFGFEGDSLALVFHDEVTTATDEVQLDESTVELNLGGSGGGYVNMGSASSLEASANMTVEGWFKAEEHVQGYDGYAILFNKEGEFEIARFPDGTIRFAVANSQDLWGWENTEYTVELGEWFHIALSFDGNVRKVYINGNEMLHASDTASGSIGDVHTDLNDFRIGGRQWDPDAQFAGQVDEVRFWNVARSMEEIRTALVDTLGPEIYTSAESGLVGYWRFDSLEDLGAGASGTNDVRDYSINENHGDMVGDAHLGNGITGIVGSTEDKVPGDFVLEQNYPNPFNPETNIEFSLKKSADVRLEVFNALGQRVATLASGKHQAGNHAVVWDGTNDFGQKVASGFYLYRMVAEGSSTGSGQRSVQTRKMVLLK